MSTRRNFDRAARKVRRYSALISRETPKMVRQIGEEMMTDAKTSQPGRGVPVDFGDLRASGRATGPRNDGTTLLSFGDSTVTYALIQHENMDYHHDIGEPRYLTRAVDRWRPGGSSAIDAYRAQVRLIGNVVGRSAG